MNEKERKDKGWWLMTEAMGWLDLRDYPRIVSLLTQALNYIPEEGDVWHNRGMAYIHMGMWQEAISDFSQAILRGPDADSYIQRAMVYYHIEKYHEARRDLESALQLNPNKVETLLKLGQVCLDTKQYNDAIHYYNQVIRIEPMLAFAFRMRAKLHLGLGEPHKAQNDMQRSANLIESGQDTSNNFL